MASIAANYGHYVQILMSISLYANQKAGRNITILKLKIGQLSDALLIIVL